MVNLRCLQILGKELWVHCIVESQTEAKLGKFQNLKTSQKKIFTGGGSNKDGIFET